MRSSSALKIRFYAFCLMGICTLISKGQNLIPDPGFEKMEHCPGKGGKKQSTLKALEEWWTTNKCSPDYMNRCAGGMDGIINNVGGSQDALDGDGYAGICHGRKTRYFESIQTRLTTPLDSGRLYLVTFHLSFGDKVFYATNEIGVSFSRSEFKGGDKEPPSDNYIPVRTGDYYTSKDKWIKLQIVYRAVGGERFFAIGFFNLFPELQLVGGKAPKAIDGEADDVYYFIDDVRVEEGISGFEYSIPGTKSSVDHGIIQKVPDIEYAASGVLPLPGGLKRLDSLALILKSDSALSIVIYFPGKELASNRYYMFRRRNDFITNFFIGKGVAPVRIREERQDKEGTNQFYFSWD